MNTRAPSLVAIVGLLAALVLGCSSSPAPPKKGANAAASSGAATAKAPAPQPVASAAASSAASAQRRQFSEEDFAENERNRDPFRTYAALFADVGRTFVRSERKVLIGRYSIDELRLVALVTRTDEPRAMLVDPTGRGWVVTKGQFIGRAEVVHAGGAGGVDYELNWRVDRIRDSDLVLLREDPAHPDVPAATRVLSLRPDKSTDNPDDMPSP